MSKKKKQLIKGVLVTAALTASACSPKPAGNRNPIMEGADPFILVHNDKYYLYFTKEADGFKVYESSDLEKWEDKGYCLQKGQGACGDHGFWAPEIIYLNDTFYMVYVTDEHLAIATSQSPLGPFTQSEQKYLDEDNAIDGHFFKDDDGTVYLYFVRFNEGNVVHVAKMNDDMISFDKSTEKFLMRAESPWEISSGYSVCEGPFILKHNNKYYLTYSCNHTKSPDYAIGYAVSDNPYGPFTRYEGNPILSKTDKVVGVGHHSFFNRITDNHLMIVYHRHFSPEQNYPRQVCLDEAEFDGDVLKIDGPTF